MKNSKSLASITSKKKKVALKAPIRTVKSKPKNSGRNKMVKLKNKNKANETLKSYDDANAAIITPESSKRTE
jgi:hypothetical protein